MAKPYVVIGAGIIGASIARELAIRGIETIVLDKERAPGMHASGRNSGVIHSGINHKLGSEKARYCLEGSKMLREYCVENSVPMEQCGTLVIARDKIEEKRLDRIWEMGKDLGVPELLILEGKDIRKVEPNCTESAYRALFSATGAIVDSGKLLESVIDDAKKNGADFSFGESVVGFENTKILMESGRSLSFDYVINSAGLQADRIAHMREVGKDLFVAPFKGSYWNIDKLKLRTMVYAPPHPEFPFLGIHLTPTTQGLTLAGPNAALALGRECYGSELNMRDLSSMLAQKGFWKMICRKSFVKQAYENSRTTLSKSAFLDEIRSLTSCTMNEADISPYRAGIRAQLVDNRGDFVNDLRVIYLEKEAHILNAVSPGMTSSLAFAKQVVNNICEKRF